MQKLNNLEDITTKELVNELLSRPEVEVIINNPKRITSNLAYGMVLVVTEQIEKRGESND